MNKNIKIAIAAAGVAAAAGLLWWLTRGGKV
jgi:hypothetical protein